eukprot:comp19593_c0_seq2/m.23060 comp19593_c0_seq2/g.23060  ORF comp19593_c0_seq2/g.23060 comp19593_c0_seq2/m.23060 type:complete len:185 (-) comp19593_c0_seq2:718-1272(-)
MDDDTLVHYAATVNHTRCLLALAHAGARMDESGCGARTPLHAAAYEGHVEAALLLMEWKAETDATDALEETPLHKAATAGHTEVACALLDRYYDSMGEVAALLHARNVLGSTPLHNACHACHFEMIQLLLSRGADPQSRDDFGYTPCDCVVQQGHLFAPERVMSVVLAFRTHQPHLILPASLRM